jgi:hypothetical protein
MRGALYRRTSSRPASLPLRRHIAPSASGPIAAGWPSRQRKLNGLAGAWSERQPRRARLPDGSTRVTSWQPAGSSTSSAAANERIILENLHAQQAP